MNHVRTENDGASSRSLVSIPSPTGNTYDIIDYINRLLEKEGVETRHNRKGGLIATIPGSDKSRHRMLTAHVDTLRYGERD